jgi:diguanylate cyclase (GGDEF)-like protein/PAS domain S-box-containing protein
LNTPSLDLGLLHVKLEEGISRAKASQTGLALLVIHLDRLKDVHETIGRRAGVVLLGKLHERWSAGLGNRDALAALGGGEFALLLPGATGEAARGVAEGLLLALERPFEVQGATVELGGSVGIVVYPGHGDDADTLLRRGDVAANEAKQSQTGYAVYAANDDHSCPERLALAADLRQAIDLDQLVLQYQPQVDVRSGGTTAVEALVRWHHPTQGLLSPDEFIPLAERSRLIRPLTRFVLRAAMEQSRAWQVGGLDIRVAVNISVHDLQDPDLPDYVAELVGVTGAAPARLCVEITESALLADPQRARDVLGRLRALGVHTSIDDFGTGYCSLAYLKDLPLDELKIDRSFVKGMADDAGARAIVRAVIDLGHDLGLQVIAEGVEDGATRTVLASLGCDIAQGYHFCPPVTPDGLAEWVRCGVDRGLAEGELAEADAGRDQRSVERRVRLNAENDFIARKRAEADLRAAEERNRLALQAARMGTWDVDLATDFHTWSPETEALFGVAPGTFAGSLANFRGAIHTDDWCGLDAEWRAALAERRDFSTTYRTIWPDGSTHWIEDNGRALYGSNGTPVRMSGTSMDITERRQNEVALRANEERFRKQYKGFPLPTFSWLQVGDDFVLQDFNDAAKTVDEGNVQGWIGGRASARYPHQPELVAYLQECVAEQHTRRREMLYRFPRTGLLRNVAITYVFVPPQTAMVHVEDLTEAKQAEQQREAMAQSEKMRALGQMASGIAHDLNQSLMLVASYSDLARQALLEVPPNLPELEDLLSTTTQAALDGGVTVKRLLQFTRTTPEHDSQPVDLNSLVRDAAQLTAPRWRDTAQAEARPISLDVEADGHPTVQGSPAQLRELMTNVIFNAVDALPSGGTIRLRVMSEAGQGIIEVIDSGVGMSAEVQERVFEPFFTTKGERGTGLGLAMVFGIVEQHRGHIEVRSAPGEGTTFRITLPLVSASAQAKQPPALDAQLGSLRPLRVLGEQSSRFTLELEPPRPLRVLAVDDEPMMTKAVVRMLKPSGHLVSVAGSGEEALQMLAEQTFDVVVSDMGMGAGMNGWELAEAVRSRWPEVRFLLATGWGAAVDPGEARSKGIEAVLSKPYRPIDLLQALTSTDAAA